MIERLPVPTEGIIEWQFQVENQMFITRYGKAGNSFYKQVVMGGKAPATPYPVKRISRDVYEIALRISTALS